MNRRWLIVSNRLPFTVDSETGNLQRGSGGLVTALSSTQADAEKIWLGLGSKEIAESKNPEMLGECGIRQLIPIEVDAELYDKYYTGFANDVLWPLFHYQTAMVNFQGDAWLAYQKVNQIFAEKILDEIQEGDLVWIHDYHLFLLPQYLRAGLQQRKLKNVRIGFFLHIPWPSSEVFRQLPVREEVIRGVLGADLVGFHDYNYLRHFATALEVLLGLECDLYHVRYDRSIQLGVFPVSIDPEKHYAALREPDVIARVAELKKAAVGKIILGVDRLDYSKGLDLKLEIFRRFLRRYPEWVGHVQLIQVAVPTRQSSPEYQKLKEKIDRLVGEINGEFSTAGYTPINYIFSSINFSELTALYHVSDLLLVSSTRDGMNLVALEYLASQNPENPGVLLLSEFAGVSAFLAFCDLINPWDIENSSQKIQEGLKLPLERRKLQFDGMRSFLEAYTAAQWGRSFMHALSKQSDRIGNTVDINLDAEDLNIGPHALTSLQKNSTYLLLDYDGTLAPITEHHSQAQIAQDVFNVVQDLSNCPGVFVTIVSGRNRNFLKEQFAGLHVGLVAEHGAQIFFPKEAKWRVNRRVSLKPWYPMAEKIMNDYCLRVPKSFVERKARSVVWHYRQSPSPFADYQAHRLASDLRHGLSEFPANILIGKKIIEVRSIESNKGRFFANFRQENTDEKSPRLDPLFIVVGDDQTDEDMFRAASRDDLTIKVGVERTEARFRLSRQPQVLPFLRRLLELRRGVSTQTSTESKAKV